jgi:hypothetical protein
MDWLSSLFLKFRVLLDTIKPGSWPAEGLPNRAFGLFFWRREQLLGADGVRQA